MLTPYDEYPVHQAPYPFSHVPVTDMAWDDGYYFGVFCPAEDVFVFTGLRVNPNVDVVGGYAGFVHSGRQYTARFSRRWRPDFDIAVGPLRYRVVEAYRDIHLTLEPSPDLELSFDLHWFGEAPARYEHHGDADGDRSATDLTRYVQAGRAAGTVTAAGSSLEIDPAGWFGCRDHSWGLYHQRAPIAPDPRWLPPAVARAGPALRFWMTFITSTHSGTVHVRESADAGAARSPFSGYIDNGWGGAVEVVRGAHHLGFERDCRVMRDGAVELVDEAGDVWTSRFTVTGRPWPILPVGYDAGTWRDGGTIQTFHPAGPSGVAIESDVLDLSAQPFRHITYDGVRLELWGSQYAAEVELTDPAGNVSTGGAQIELLTDGPHDRYGLTEAGPPPPPQWRGYAVLDEG